MKRKNEKINEKKASKKKNKKEKVGSPGRKMEAHNPFKTSSRVIFLHSEYTTDLKFETIVRILQDRQVENTR